MTTTTTDEMHDDVHARWGEACRPHAGVHASATAPVPPVQTGPTTTIREATAADVDVIVAMGLRFQQTTTYALHLRATEATLRALTAAIVANDDAVIVVAERHGAVVGMIAASLYVQPMSGELIGTEICWWMEPEARGGRSALRLVRAAEAWALDRGAVVFQMMAPAGTAVGAFYEALRYAPIEMHYQRRLP